MHQIDLSHAVTTLDLHVIWLECLAESAGQQGMSDAERERARQHARGLDKLSKRLADFTLNEAVYSIERPYAPGVIEVYCPTGEEWFEWRIIEDARTVHDTAAVINPDGSSGLRYGSAGIALRDALNHDEPPYTPPLVRQIEWLPGRHAADDNREQAERLASSVEVLADDLHSARVEAQARRARQSPEHVSGMRAMVYLDERIRFAAALAEEMHAAAARLRALAEGQPPAAPEDKQQ